MSKIGSLVQKVRSKNAGPFWLTIDIFCGAEDAYKNVISQLNIAKVAQVLGANSQDIKRFDIPSLNVVKISLPRPTIQGSIKDRDMHGASWAALIAEMDI
jgi:hypothetical protein